MINGTIYSPSSTISRPLPPDPFTRYILNDTVVAKLPKYIKIIGGSTMSIQFTDVCFITEDVLRLRTFYESVFGGKIEGNEIHSSLILEELTFNFDYVVPLQGNTVFRYVTGGGANNVIIGFNVDDADEEYQQLLLLGVEMLNQPTTHPWGARSFQFKDPDGNILNFRSWPKGN